MKRNLFALAIAALIVVPAAGAHAALNAYLQLKGTSTKSFAPDTKTGLFQALCTNEVLSAVPNQPAAQVGEHQVKSPRDAASGQATGKRMHKPFYFTKQYDKASPVLAKAFQTQEALPEVTIYLYKELPDGMVEIYMKITMFDCMISSYGRASGPASLSASGQSGLSSGGDRPMESLSMNYTKIQYEQVTGKQKNDRFMWDLAVNKKI